MSEAPYRGVPWPRTEALRTHAAETPAFMRALARKICLESLVAPEVLAHKSTGMVPKLNH